MVEEGIQQQLKGIKFLKSNKAAGIDGMLCEQIKNFGPATLRWVLQMMNSILKSHRVPKLLRKKVIAMLKLGNTLHYIILLLVLFYSMVLIEV